MTNSRADRELILYASPTGDLAAACARYFEHVGSLAPTVAQTYPPHCTLTGFFHRSLERAEIAIREITAAAAGPVPSGAVRVEGLRCTPDWVGLELRSEWLIDRAAIAIDAHAVQVEEDALRPKDWLHLSLAYGADDLAWHGKLAAELIDPDLGVEWEVGLWERLPNGSWRCHRSVDDR